MAADFVQKGGRGAGLEEPQSPSTQALTQTCLDGTAQRDDRGAVFVHELLRDTLLHYLLNFFFNVGNQSLLELFDVRRCEGKADFHKFNDIELKS